MILTHRLWWCWIFFLSDFPWLPTWGHIFSRLNPVFCFHMHGSCSTSSKSLIEMQLSPILFYLQSHNVSTVTSLPPSLLLSHTSTHTHICSAHIKVNARLSLQDPNSPKLHVAGGKQQYSFHPGASWGHFDLHLSAGVISLYLFYDVSHFHIVCYR